MGEGVLQDFGLRNNGDLWGKVFTGFWAEILGIGFRELDLGIFGLRFWA